MSLLSPAQRAQFKQAIRTVTDEFFKIPIVIVTRTRKLSAFNQGRKGSTSETETEFIGLKVYDSQGNEAKSQQTESGAFNLTEGYVLINYEDFVTKNFIDADGNPTVEAHQDTVKMFGDEFEIEGVNLIGPVEDKFALVKLHFSAYKHG